MFSKPIFSATLLTGLVNAYLDINSGQHLVQHEAVNDVLGQSFSAINTFTCSQCIRADYEWVPNDDTAWFKSWDSTTASAAVTTSMAGKCCSPNFYNSAAAGCGIPADRRTDNQNLAPGVMSSKSSFKAIDVAYHGCPTDSSKCGASKIIELQENQPQYLNIGFQGQDTETCTYLLKAKCLAPTFKLNTDNSKGETAPEGVKTIDQVYELSYFEYTQDFADASYSYWPKLDFFLESQDVVADPSLFVGGEMFKLKQEYSSASYGATKFTKELPGSMIAMWMKQKRDQIEKYHASINPGGRFHNEVRQWNYLLNPKEQMKREGVTDEPDEEELKKTMRYQDNGTAWISEFGKPLIEDRPERPNAPTKPLPYSGPVVCTKSDLSTCEVDTLQLKHGFGRPATGFIKPSLGGKSFGVQGQGNIIQKKTKVATGAKVDLLDGWGMKVVGVKGAAVMQVDVYETKMVDIPDSDLMHSVVYPAQSMTCSDKWNYVALTIRPKGHTGVNKISLRLEASMWSGYNLDTPPTPMSLNLEVEPRGDLARLSHVVSGILLYTSMTLYGLF